MTNLLNKVETNINSKETLKLTTIIEVPRVEEQQDRYMKQRYEEDRSNRSNERQSSDRRESKLPALK